MSSVAGPKLERQRSFLWGLCYRMTGSASDADDLVQETFMRAIERPPQDLEAPLRPWLVRVATNLSRDQLRRRRRRRYPGTWLPEPVFTRELEPSDETDTPEARYGRLESASYAFLLALEALTPLQRAVLVLRDAFDYSSRETAESLDVSEENVRVILHRARKTMAGYDRQRRAPDRALESATEQTLRRLIACLARRDVEGVSALLATDARSLSDGGGVHFTARAPVVGAEKIAKLYMNLVQRASQDSSYEVHSINGLPAVVATDPAPKSPAAPRVVFRIELDQVGKIREVHSILAPAKLGAVFGSNQGIAPGT